MEIICQLFTWNLQQDIVLNTNISFYSDDDPEWVWDHFNQSLPMSTYLVAFVVSDFENLNSTANDHVLFRGTKTFPEISSIFIHKLHMHIRLII